MRYLKKFSFISALVFLIYCCSDTPETRWISLVSSETSFVVVPGQSATLDSVLTSELIPFLDDVSSSSIQLISRLDSTAGQSLQLKSILLYPGTSQKLEPIWITQTTNNIREKLKDKYARPFAQNEYYFNDISILDLQIDDRHFYVAQINNLLLISESSIGIENAIRTYRGIEPATDLSALQIEPGSIIINTPSLDGWLKQLVSVSYAPSVNEVLRGTRPALLSITEHGSGENKQFQFSGNISLGDTDRSPLISAISSPAKPITLDGYISSNAAAYGIFQAEPEDLPAESIPDTSTIDAYLLDNPEFYNRLAAALDTEFGLVMYTQSGLLSTGQHLFMRKLADAEAFRNQLETLSAQNSLEKVEGVYFTQSYLLSRLIGSPLCSFKGFYINITGDAAVISKRKALTERIASDRSRRRVLSYESSFKQIREATNDRLSSLFVAGPEFYSYLSPFLTTDNYVEALTSSYDYIAITTQYAGEPEAISLNISTFEGGSKNEPYRENWFFPTGGAELSGRPVFGNVAGNFNDEVVFATKTGSVHVLAADGTPVQQYNTGSDVPIGAPVVYDWYGSGQNVVLIAAGNKIYGWDESGDLLPKFPFEFDEQITTPLTIADLNENRLPDAIVATADRKLHVLNGRGNNLSGWPVTTNARVSSAPLVDYFDGRSAVIAFSSNAIHAWDAAGRPLGNFPVFVNASLNGSPVLFNDNIMGNAVDGNLYAVGNISPFSDSLDTSITSSNVSGINVTNSPLTGTPSVDQNSILTASSSGSVFLLTSEGKLRLTKSMGQPSAGDWSSFITDINSDGHKDIVALANYGRLYAWDITTGNRISNLPAAAIKQLNVTDLDGDGLKELIAQTDEGVQSWTINR